jgi:hypothetical protein
MRSKKATPPHLPFSSMILASSVTFPPAQKVTAPLAVILGAILNTAFMVWSAMTLLKV